ncbi:TPA: hypothetical protein ACSP71_004365, partial [Aeromonas hydrophila]
LQIQSLSPPKLTNPVSQYNRCHIQLVEHDPRLPRLGSRVRVSFPAPISLQIQSFFSKLTNPISLRSSHHPFELPITSRRDDLSYPAFSQIGPMSSVPRGTQVLEGCGIGKLMIVGGRVAVGRLMSVAGKGKRRAKK